MNQERANYRGKVRSAAISIVVGGFIVWLLLRKIDLWDIPNAIGNIPLRSLGVAFLLHVIATFLKAFRFKVILRSGIRLKHLFPIVSLYMFFANVLPIRTGELSYVYLLKKHDQTSGTKSFASLVIGAIADLLVILVGFLVVGFYLGDALAEGAGYFFSALEHQAGTLAQKAKDNILSIIIVGGFLTAGVIALIFIRRRVINREHGLWRHASTVKSKIREVGRELADTPLDLRLVGIFICSILIIVFRFGTQCYLVRSMGIDIGIWKLNFALLFGALFALLPIHGPAGFGTVEAPWVMILLLLSVPRADATTSGFSLHIIIIMFSIIMGIYGALNLRILRYVQNRNSVTG